MVERVRALASSLRADRARRWLAILLVAGAALRVGGAVYLGDKMVPVPGAYDQIFYHDLSLNLLAGKGFVFTQPPWPFIQAGEPTAYYSFLYPLFLAAVYAVAGPHPIAARVVQALLCSLQPLLVYSLIRKVLSTGPPARPGTGSSEVVPLIAAAITAGYAYFVLYAASLQTEGLYLLLVLWALILTHDLSKEPDWKRWLGWGLAVTLASLIRQVFMPVAVLLFLYVMAKAWRRTKVWHVVMAGAVAVALILPFTLRNYRVYGRFLLLNSQYGQVLWNANHPDLGTHFVGDAMFPIPADLEGTDEVELTNELMRRGLRLIAEDPGRFALLSLSRAATLFMFWPSSESSLMSNISRSLSFMVFLPFMVAGLVLSAREWRRWLLLYLFISAYVLIHIVSWAQIRYRMPVDAVLVPFAALACVALARLWQRRRVGVHRGGPSEAS